MNKVTQGKNPAEPSKPNPIFWIAGFVSAILIVALILVGSWYASKPPAQTPPASPRAVASAKATISHERLLGRWIRPDGGYVLENRRAELSGRLEVAYFNPNPINVSRAEWHREEDQLGVFVELRDVNYPGSTYKLTYLPAEDRLKGTYFQAATGESYEIEFIRVPENNQ